MSTVKEFNTSDELINTLCEEICGMYNQTDAPFVCYAAGDTPLPLFRALIEQQRKGDVNLRNADYLSLDEWWGIGYETLGSCAQVMKDNYYYPAGVPSDRMTLFNGLADSPEEEILRVSAIIEEKGPLNLLVLGVGMNGHVGFIEPGTISNGLCELVPLSETTKNVSTKYFGVKTPLTYGISIGLKTMMDADRIIIMAYGKKKAEIVARMIDGPISNECPASLFRDLDNVVYFIDSEAASLLKT